MAVLSLAPLLHPQFPHPSPSISPCLFCLEFLSFFVHLVNYSSLKTQVEHSLLSLS